MTCTYPYHPHVTVAHDVPTEALDRVYAELAGFDARFTVDHFTLYVHGDGRQMAADQGLPAPARPVDRATRADR